MGRVFRRGELKEAIVVVLAALGEAHGYAIMSELRERVGGTWKPSPGAIYPAILGLVESGHVRSEERDGTRVYSLTELGVRAAQKIGTSGRWDSLAARSEAGEPRVTVGSLLDRFAAGSTLRRRLARTEQRARIETILERTEREIEGSLTEGDSDG